MSEISFDFDGYRAACEAGAMAAWLVFFADDVDWIEYRQEPLVLVRRATGRTIIGESLTKPGRWSELLAIEEPEVELDRIRFRALSRPAGGQRMVDHVMLTVAADRIQGQVSVVAFDDGQDDA